MTMNPQTEGHDEGRLRQRVEQSREEVREDLEALKQKLSPENIKREVKDAINDRVASLRDEARTASQRVARGARESVRRNPLPILLMGVGAGWLIYDSYSRGRRRGHWYRPEDDYTNYDYEASEHDTNLEGNHRTGLVSAAQEASSKVRSAIGKGTRAVADEGRHIARRVADRSRDATTQAGHYAREAGSRAAGFYESSPLVAAGIALAAGVGVAMLIPSTRSEDDTMGHYRDELLERSKREALKAKDAAQRAVSEAVHGTADEAERRGIAPGQLETKARQAASDVKEVFQSGVERGQESLRETRREPKKHES